MDDRARPALAYEQVLPIAARAMAELRAQAEMGTTSTLSSEALALATAPAKIVAWQPHFSSPPLTPGAPPFVENPPFPKRNIAYTLVEFDSRFHDTIIGADTYVFGPERKLQSYAVMHSWQDTRSTSGTHPEIYNDNAEALAGGFRFNLDRHADTYLFAEGGEGFSLVGRGSHPETRIGLASWAERGSASRTSYGFNLASYSWYAGNIIGYGSLLHDFPLPHGNVRGVVGINFSCDTHREYFNNIAEFTAGIQFGTPRLHVTLLGVYGQYLARGIDIPGTHAYTSLRPMISWSPTI